VCQRYTELDSICILADSKGTLLSAHIRTTVVEAFHYRTNNRKYGGTEHKIYDASPSYNVSLLMTLFPPYALRTTSQTSRNIHDGETTETQKGAR